MYVFRDCKIIVDYTRMNYKILVMLKEVKIPNVRVGFIFVIVSDSCHKTDLSMADI